MHKFSHVLQKCFSFIRFQLGTWVQNLHFTCIICKLTIRVPLFLFTQACHVEADWLSVKIRVLLSRVNTQEEPVLPRCLTWWEEKVREKKNPLRINGDRVIRLGRCTCIHVAYFLFISNSYAFRFKFESLCSPSLSHLVSPFFALPPLLFVSFFLSCTHKTRQLFLAGWLWKCAVINMLPWLLILSNGSVRLWCLDKYQRWGNIWSAAQTHNVGEQLGLID